MKFCVTDSSTISVSSVKCFVVYGGETITEETKALFSVPIYTWEEFMVLGEHISESELDEREQAITPGHCATLIYTSGTTGPPKACMLSHDNITWTLQAFVDQVLPNPSHEDRIISYLPLSHIAAQLIDIHYSLTSGSCVYFAKRDALSGSLVNTLKVVRPTYFFGVPRVWEKMQEKMVHMSRGITGIKHMIASWAKRKGKERCTRAQYGEDGGEPLFFGCANAFLLSKIKVGLGLDACKAFLTAAAPISEETLWYFASLNIPIYELFGQSESTSPHCSSKDDAWKIGKCGRPLRGTTTKIDGTTGELCMKGRHVFMGYM